MSEKITFSMSDLINADLLEPFDLINGDLSTLEIVEVNGGGNCYIRSKDGYIRYDSFVLDKNTRTTILCELTFFPSSLTHRYIPRPVFRKVKNDGTDQTCRGEAIRIDISEGNTVQRFWKLIGFLGSFKEIVDTDSFDRKYQVLDKDYASILKSLGTPEILEFISRLIKDGKLSSENLNSIVYETRKKVLKRYLWLLRNRTDNNGKTAYERYKEHYKLKGDEAVWHHFFKKNDWILGLNADIRFIADIIDEPKVGVEDSKGRRNPKADFLGISNYTTLIELKTPGTPLFKQVRGSNSRSDTWEFSSEFISGVSQCLGQKFSLDESYLYKEIVNAEGEIISKEKVFNADVKAIFIIGNRYAQFPHDNVVDNNIKSKTFEFFRRNNRNVEIITYDELFERAYHIVFSKKIDKDWFSSESFNIE